MGRLLWVAFLFHWRFAYADKSYCVSLFSCNYLTQKSARARLFAKLSFLSSSFLHTFHIHENPPVSRWVLALNNEYFKQLSVCFSSAAVGKSTSLVHYRRVEMRRKNRLNSGGKGINYLALVLGAETIPPLRNRATAILPLRLLSNF